MVANVDMHVEIGSCLAIDHCHNIMSVGCAPYIWETSCRCQSAHLFTKLQMCSLPLDVTKRMNSWKLDTILDDKSDDFSRGDESCQRGRSNGCGADWRTNQNRCMGRIKGNNQPSLAGLKTSYEAYIVHRLGFKHATVKDRLCRTMYMMFLVGKRILSQLELTERLDIVWDTDLPYSLKHLCEKVEMVENKLRWQKPGHLHWQAFLHAVSKKEHVYDILAGKL